MNVKSAYITTKGAAALSYSPRLPLFNGGIITMGQRPDAIVEVSNLDSLHDCPSDAEGVTGIDSYSSLFLDRTPIWYHDSGANLWRINRGHKGTWHNLPISVREIKYEQDTGEPILMANLKDPTPTLTNLQMLASKDGQGYCKPITEGGSTWTPGTYTAFTGAGDAGYFSTGTSDADLADVLGDDYIAGGTPPLNTNEIPLEGRTRATYEYSDLEYFALNDFFGVDDDVFIKYGNIRPTGGGRVLTAETYMYIPLVRTIGYTKLKAKCKIYQTDVHPSAALYNYVGIGAGAVVDGSMEQVIGKTNNEEWLELTVDYSSLPYIDYLILYGRLGALGIKDVVLTIS